MKRLRLVLVAPPLALALLAIAAGSGAQPKPSPACVASRGEPRARALGYDHVVIITNGCDRAVTCTVSTDVAPDPVTTTVAPKQTAELTTFRGSPAREFHPRVDCKLP